MPQDGTANLKPQNTRTKEEQRLIASMGGKASGEARRRKKAMREIAKEILSMPLKDEELDEIVAFAEVKGKNITVSQAALFAQAQKALQGDTSALTFLRDTAGEKPVEQVEVSGDIAAAAANIRKMVAEAKAKDGNE